VVESRLNTKNSLTVPKECGKVRGTGKQKKQKHKAERNAPNARQQQSAVQITGHDVSTLVRASSWDNK
jgi:hypothetical protein